MGKKHASQYANFGWLQIKVCAAVMAHTIINHQKVFLHYYIYSVPDAYKPAP